MNALRRFSRGRPAHDSCSSEIGLVRRANVIGRILNP
jgi:hypothetical protein